MSSSKVRSLVNVPSLNLLGDVDLLLCYSKVGNIIAREIDEPILNNKDQHVLDVIDTKSWEVAFLECVKVIDVSLCSYLHGYDVCRQSEYAALGIDQARFLVKSWRRYVVSLELDTEYWRKFSNFQMSSF
ncbi:hypothetical protein Tco_1377134 [Tanacetum coccineum]